LFAGRFTGDIPERHPADPHIPVIIFLPGTCLKIESTGSKLIQEIDGLTGNKTGTCIIPVTS
jgi:hypothetical protein